MTLTGRFDLRKTFTGKVVLRVEEEVERLWFRSGERPTKKRWRDATLVDLTTPEMRTLMDARFRRHLVVHPQYAAKTATSPGSNALPTQTQETANTVNEPKGERPDTAASPKAR